MRKFIFSILFLSFASFLHAQSIIDMQAMEALRDGDYYKMRELVLNHAEDMDSTLYRMCKPISAYVFNQNKEAEEAFCDLLYNHGADYTFEHVSLMAYQSARNYFILQDYANAAAISNNMIEIIENSEEIPNSEANAFRQGAQLNSELAKYPICTIEEREDGWSIPFRIDTLYHKDKKSAHILIDGTINGNNTNIVFDSGMGMNIITPEYAQRFGLKLINAQMEMNGAGKVSASCAIADKLIIGDMLLHNVLFLVTDLKTGDAEADEAVKNVNVIIGAYVMRLMRELTLDFEHNRITVPATPHDYGEPNFHISPSNLLLYLRATHDGEPIMFNIDTGNGGEWAHLDATYYDAHKSAIDAITETEETREAGMGGIIMEKKAVLRDFTLNISGRDITLLKVLVSKQHHEGTAIADNALGIEFFTHQKRVTISMKDSRMEIEN